LFHLCAEYIQHVHRNQTHSTATPAGASQATTQCTSGSMRATIRYSNEKRWSSDKRQNRTRTCKSLSIDPTLDMNNRTVVSSSCVNRSSECPIVSSHHFHLHSIEWRRQIAVFFFSENESELKKNRSFLLPHATPPYRHASLYYATGILIAATHVPSSYR
jgi:hypothetical protein